MNTVRITYERLSPHSYFLTRRIVHAPAWMSEARARACVFGFIRGFDRVERETGIIFDAAGMWSVTKAVRHRSVSIPEIGTVILRTCRRCRSVKPIAEFPRHPKTKRPIKVCRACMPQYQRGGKPERERRRQWTLRNAEKRKAHKAVEYAILRGVIVKKPCVTCGAENTQAHHDDYSKPLDVMWLCPKCHAARHKEIGRPFGPKAVA